MLLLLLFAALAAVQTPAPELSSLARLLTTGDRDQARRQAVELLWRAANEPPKLLALGQLLATHKEFSLAEQAFQRAAELEPASFPAQFNLGLTLYQQANKAAEAIRALRKASELGSEQAGVAALLGVAYLEGGYSADAAEVLERAVKLSPSNPNVALLLAQAYHQNYDFAKALAAARATATRFPNSANAHFRLAYELETGGNFADAEACYQEALRLEHGHPEASLGLGRYKLKAGRAQEAIPYFEAALRSFPTNGEARLGLARALFLSRQTERARVTAFPLIAEKPDDPAPHLLLSQIYQAEGNAELARKERERFLELSNRLSQTGGMSSNVPARKPKRFEP